MEAVIAHVADLIDDHSDVPLFEGVAHFRKIAERVGVLLDREDEVEVVFAVARAFHESTHHALHAVCLSRVDLHEGEEEQHFRRNGRAPVERRVLGVEERAVEGARRARRSEVTLHPRLAAGEDAALDADVAVAGRHELAQRSPRVAPRVGGDLREDGVHGRAGRSPGGLTRGAPTGSGQ